MNAQNLLQQAARKSRERIRRDIEELPRDLGAVLALVEKNLFEPSFNVRHAGALASQLRRLRLALKQTLQQYIEDRRLETACELLAGTTLRAAEISAAVGYSSISAFSRAFMRWSGERPSTYRRNHHRPLPQGLPEDAEALPESIPPSTDDDVHGPSKDVWRQLQQYPREEQAEKLLGFYPTDGHLVLHFCRKSRQLRHHDPEGSIHQAYLATVAAKLMVTESMSPEDETENLRMRVESWAELGQAYRRAGMTTRALRAAARADSWAYGRLDIPLTARVRLLTLEAGVRRDEEKYREAIALIDRAIALVPKDDKALIGELLTKKGAAQSASGDIGGLMTIEKGLKLIHEAAEETSAADEEEPSDGSADPAP